ncbi:MAG: aldo/keto reductase [Chloroflexi bacterium]|nr:aldo/keto reductase [Chloroflexota bacterium]
MDYRPLGKTGLNVSPIGFGGAPMGLQGYLGDEDRDAPAFRESAKEAVREAIARGINYFDTAPGYGDGRSERLLGEALQDCRDRVVLATKYPFRPDASTEERTRDLLVSLDRLRTPYVDVLQLHGERFSDELAEQILTCGVLEWAASMKQEGLCHHTGITAEGPSGGLERLLRTGQFEVLEINYNLCNQAVCDYQREPAGIIPLARSLGIGVTTMRSATSGFLQKLLTAAFPGLDASAVTTLALNYVLSTPEVDCAVVGMKRASEVIANVRLAEDTKGRLDLRRLHNRYE